jgi:uncharacterized protein (DUF302 family)
MKVFASLLAASAVLLSVQANAVEGLIALKSPYSTKETLDRLEKTLEQKGMTIFARIDHAAGAAKIGKALRPTELLIFGNPKGGTPFMECAQTAGIDLPLKALAWKDATGQVWLGYNDPAFLARRHEAPQCKVTDTMRDALRAFAENAVAQ